MLLKQKKFITTSLLLSTIFGVYFSSNFNTSEYRTEASDSFSLDLTTAGTALATNSNSTAAQVLTFLNSQTVSPNITPIQSVNEATTVRGSGNPAGLEVGTNAARGKLHFTLATGFEFSQFNVNARISNTAGTVVVNYTGVYKPIAGLDTPANKTVSITMTTTFTSYPIDLSNSTSPHVISQLIMEPGAAGNNNTNFIMSGILNFDTSGGAALSFEQKVLSYSPCSTNNLSGVSVINEAQAIALRNEYLALGQNTKVKFNRTQNDPNGAYQRYLFICQKYNLNPFSA